MEEPRTTLESKLERLEKLAALPRQTNKLAKIVVKMHRLLERERKRIASNMNNPRSGRW